MFKTLSMSALVMSLVACAPAAWAGNYMQNDGSMSTGHVLEFNGKPVGEQNPLPALDLPARERAARLGNYFVYSTGNGGDFTKGGITVPAGSFLNVRTCNVGKKTAYITKRIFDSNHSSPVAYGGVANAAPLTGAQVSNQAVSAPSGGTNIVVGQLPSTTLQMTFSVGTGHVDNAAGNAAPAGTGFIPPNDKYELTELRILPPNQCFGQYANGAAAGLGSIQLGFRMYVYEE